MALTETTRWTVVEGPIKREVIIVTSDSTDSDTLVSRLANPDYVSIVGANGTATPSDITVSESSRTLTVTNPNASETYRITVEGF